MENGRNSSGLQVEISWKTIIKLLLGVLLAFVAVKLWPVFKLLVISILLAVTLYRIVFWACNKGWPRWVGLILASLALLLVVIGIPAVVGPVAFSQASQFGKNLPKLKGQVVSHLPADGPFRNVLEDAVSFGSGSDFQHLSQQALTAATTTLGGLLDVVLVIALTIYMMADGPRALKWMITCFSRDQRLRVSKGFEEIAGRIVAYVIGQSIVSGLFAAFVFILLSILHVPMALLLALLAGVLDVVPIVGISVSMTLALLMGLTVSPTTGLLVLIFYCVYHILENYLVIPKVYGKKLQLSTLAVLLSMIIGGTLAGVVGAIAVLPLVAAYPALEKLWLAPPIEREVVKDHQKQLRAA